MSDEAGAAPAAADSAPAPESVPTPNPVATEAQGHPEPEKTEPAKAEVKPEPEAKKPISTREALEKAAAKVEKDNPPVKGAEKTADKTPPVKSDAPRDETGKFAAKEGDKPAKAPEAKVEAKPSFTANEPPARISNDVKEIWATLPENARAEWTRMHKELTQGYEKHKASAEEFENIREFHDLAKNTGTDLKTALTHYVGIERQLRAEPIKGLEQICQNIGISLRDVAAHVMGQTPEQSQSQADATIRELKQQVAQLTQQVGTVSQTFQHQVETATQAEVEKFAAAEGHERFEELSPDIVFFLQSGRAKDLSEAYALADRLNPAPAQASTQQPAASSAPAIDLSAQTDKGQKSIAGSPSSGSNPVNRQPSNSIKESLRRAMAQAG